MKSLCSMDGYDPGLLKARLKILREGVISGRGFLSNYPPDVVAVINGNPVTKADILQRKRERQAEELRRKRHNPYEYITIKKPCFVWVFDNGSAFPFCGKWLAIKTLHREWCKDIRGNADLALQAMTIFPLGLSPSMENFGLWQERFIRDYHRPIKNRPTGSGMAVAYAEMSNGRLVGICAKPNTVKPKLNVPLSALRQLSLFDYGEIGN